MSNKRKRWANSDAGQAARMTNPAGFANVRAHAEAHLHALSAPSLGAALLTSGLSTRSRGATELFVHAGADADEDRPGDHWVTIDGHPVLIHEPQGKKNQRQSHTPPEAHDLMDDRDVEIHAFRLFEASGFGSAPTEHSMWVISKDGKYSFIIWPWSAEAGKEKWRGPAPEGSVAIIHTHPTAKSERPSPGDHDLANGKQAPDVRMPVYVVHRNGIWKAVPGAKEPIQVRDYHWLSEFKP